MKLKAVACSLVLALSISNPVGAVTKQPVNPKLEQSKMYFDLYDYHKQINDLREWLSYDCNWLNFTDYQIVYENDPSGLEAYPVEKPNLQSTYKQLVTRKATIYKKYKLTTTDKNRIDQNLKLLSESLTLLDKAYNDLNTFNTTRQPNDNMAFINSSQSLYKKLNVIFANESKIYPDYYKRAMALK